MYLSSSQQQASSVSSLCKKQIEGYESAQKAIADFVGNAPNLKGKAYDSGKAYFNAVLSPLAKGGILLSEAVEKAVKKFPEDYIAKVDSGDLKQSELEERIREVSQRLSQMQTARDVINSSKTPDLSKGYQLTANSMLMNVYNAQKQKLQEKLEKLLEFNATSPQLFSDIASLQSAVEQGLAQTTNAWNASTGTFTVPSGKDLEWTKAVNTAYDKANQEKMDKITSAPYTTESALDFYDFVKNNPGTKLTKEALAWAKEHEADLQGLFNDFSLSAIEQGLKSNGDDIAVQVGMLFGSVYKNAPYGSWMSGVNQGLTAGVTNVANTAFKTTSDFLGSTFKSSVLGIGVGTALGMSTGDSFGQALASSTVATGVSLGINAIAVVALGSNPVGWAAVGLAVGVSAVTTIAYNSNFLGMKDFANGMGTMIDDGIEWSGKKINEVGKGIKQVGSVVEDTWDSLTSWSW